MAALIKPSEFDGTPVLYVDKFHFQHSGVIVGQSQDGKWLYVQSDNPNVEDADWHFKVTRGTLPALLAGRG